MTLVFDQKRFQQGMLVFWVMFSSMTVLVVGCVALQMSRPELVA